MNNKKITATDIKLALGRKHERAGDFFITECKNGSTYFPADRLLIFDGLAIKKSWTKPCITIYEIKTSRGDFQGDNKYRLYLPYCHEMYFVCPTGMIDKSEIDADIGLMTYNHEKKSFTTRLKAPHRHIEYDPNMLMYIIMNKLDTDRVPYFGDNATYLEEWLRKKRSNRELSYYVKTELVQRLAEQDDQLRTLTWRLEDSGKATEELKNLKEMLSTAGYDFWGKTLPMVVSELIEAKESPALKRVVDNLKRDIDRLSRIVNHEQEDDD